MYNGLVHAHSGLRWVVLVLLIYAIINAFGKKGNGSEWTNKDKKITLFAMIFTHIQLLIGLVLYFISPLVSFSEGFMKNPVYRFYSVEHISLMLVAIALITVGYSKTKRAAESAKKFKAVSTFYLIGLILILVSIPWPFRELGAGWF
jgi:uncharacterized membrane protein YozB (DUF420 family)